MSVHPPLQALTTFALGIAPGARQTALRTHLMHCTSCRSQFVSLCDDLARLSLVVSPAVVPPLLKESILHSICEIHRLYDACWPLARVLAVSVRKARDVLAQLDAPKHWQLCKGAWRLQLPHCRWKKARIERYSHPQRLTVRIGCGQPCAGIPRLLMILQGSGSDPAGQSWRAGSLPPTTANVTLRAEAGADLLVVVADGPSRHGRLARSAGHQGVTRAGNEGNADNDRAQKTARVDGQ